MLKYLRFILVLVALNLLALSAWSQNLEGISTEEWFKYRGGLNLNSTAYDAVGMDSRRDPFFWGIDANLNITLFNIINVPLTAHYSKDNHTYSHPTYNYFGVSPSYKAVTLHAGYRTMQFSNYSLSGVTFLGGGIEIKPKDALVKFSAMYGRFAKAVAYKADSQQVANANPLDVPGYERWGYGGKLTIGREKHSVDLILFKAKDDPNSIPDPGQESGIKPQENLVIGFNTSNQLTERVTLRTEYSLSAFSRDLRVAERKLETFSYVNNVGDLFTPRYSSSVNSAYSVNVSYAGETFATGIVFKHIDPEYRSLGTTYMSNDLENIYVNLKKSFLDNGVSISGNLGHERNNLSKTLDATNKRVIGSANCNITLLNPLTLSLSYANFNANTQPVATTMQDTFKYVQVTENMGFNASYQYAGEKFTHNLNVSSMIQSVNTLNKNATRVTDINTRVLNANMGYNLFWTQLKLSFITSLNYNLFNPGGEQQKTTGWAPTMGINKQFFKGKIQTNLMYTHQSSETSNMNTTHMNVLRFNSSYKATSRQRIRLSLNMMFRNLETDEKVLKQEEYRARLTYSYAF